MRYVWIAFKGFVSAVIITLALVIAFVAVISNRWLDPMALGLVALLFFFAALPWAYPFKQSPRAAGLICIFLAILCAVLSYQVWFGDPALPENCASYRRNIGCHMINAIYGVSGRAGVAALWAGVAGLLLWGAFTLIKRARREYA
jgi:hypothetical protein